MNVIDSLYYHYVVFSVNTMLFLLLITYCGAQVAPSSSLSTVAFFNQSSLVTLPSTVINFRNKIAFSFRTCSSGTLLFQEGSTLSGNNVTMDISETGSLDLTIFENNVQYFVSVGRGLTDNHWYTVDSSFLNGEILLKIERGAALIASHIISNSTYNRFLWDLNLSGGSGLLIGIQFTGCIQEGPSVNLGDSSRKETGVLWDTCPLDSDPNFGACSK